MARKTKPTKSKTTTKRVGRKRRKVSRLQALLVAIVVALLGAIVVFATQASGTPDYQYSWSAYCVTSHGASSASQVQDCKDRSAEAMVYRLYQGLYKRNPDSGGYAFWTQKLAGERVKPLELGLIADQVSKMGSDSAFVTALYTNMLGRNPRGKELSFWTSRLGAKGSKQWSRTRVALQFATSTEAIRVTRTKLNSYLASAPRVTVVQVAAQDQRKRFDAMLADYQQPNKTYLNSAVEAAKKASNELDKSKYISAKKAPSASDLEAIKTEQIAAENYYKQVRDKAVVANNNTEAAARLYERAAELASYAKDIGRHSVYGITKIKDRYNTTRKYSEAISDYQKSVIQNIQEISSNYGIAEQKYQAEQQRIAQEAAAKKSGSSSSGSSGSSPGSSSKPAARGSVKILKVNPEYSNISLCILSKTNKFAEYSLCRTDPYKTYINVIAKATKSGAIKACGVYRAAKAQEGTALLRIYKPEGWLTKQELLIEGTKTIIGTGHNVPQKVCTKDIVVHAGQKIMVVPTSDPYTYFNSLTIN